VCNQQPPFIKQHAKLRLICTQSTLQNNIEVSQGLLKPICIFQLHEMGSLRCANAERLDYVTDSFRKSRRCNSLPWNMEWIGCRIDISSMKVTEKLQCRTTISERPVQEARESLLKEISAGVKTQIRHLFNVMRHTVGESTPLYTDNIINISFVFQGKSDEPTQNWKQRY
jgi:hypothetical protein